MIMRTQREFGATKDFGHLLSHNILLDMGESTTLVLCMGLGCVACACIGSQCSDQKRHDHGGSQRTRAAQSSASPV